MSKHHNAFRLKMLFHEQFCQLLQFIPTLAQISVGGIKKDQIDRIFRRSLAAFKDVGRDNRRSIANFQRLNVLVQ